MDFDMHAPAYQSDSKLMFICWFIWNQKSEKASDTIEIYQNGAGEIYKLLLLFDIKCNLFEFMNSDNTVL